MEGIAAHFIKLKPSVQKIFDGKTQMRRKEKQHQNVHARALLREEFLLEPAVLRVILLML